MSGKVVDRIAKTVLGVAVVLLAALLWLREPTPASAQFTAKLSGPPAEVSAFDHGVFVLESGKLYMYTFKESDLANPPKHTHMLRLVDTMDIP